MKPTGSAQSLHNLGITTMLPFLYETKTILAAASLRHATARTRLHASTTRATFTSCARLRNIPWEDGTNLGNNSPSFRGVRRGGPRIGYDERTIKYTRSQPGSFGANKDDMDFSFQRHDPEGDDFEISEDPIDYSSGPRRPDPESTITVTEKQAFDQIFASIRARTSKQTSDYNTFSSTGQTKSPVETLEDIMNEAVLAKEKKAARRGLALDGQTISGAQDEIKEAIQKYPAVLQAGAAKALRSTMRAASLDLDEISSYTAELEKQRQGERERVEMLMRNAASDVELWEVMEVEVFPMISKLGLADAEQTQAVETVKPKKSRAKKNKKAQSSALDEVLATEESGLDLEIHGPLYPAYLLLGLRLLDRSFSKPSPLVASVLPRIKSLGLMSRVLGASTALYNELLRITYRRYDNFPAVLALLQEMDQAGLELDIDTKREVDMIVGLQSRMRDGDMGPALKTLAAMPGWVRDTGSDFSWWRRRVQGMLKERQQEIEKKLEWSSPS